MKLGADRIWLLAATVALAGIMAACADKAVAPEDGERTPAADSVAVTIPVDDVTLSARMFGREHPVGVILSHMHPNDQTAWFGFAEELSTKGYAALTFDFRGYGDSDGKQEYDKLDDDLRAAVEYLRSQGKTKIFLVGASMGGTTSLVVAGDEDVAGVVSISSPSEFEDQNALEAVPGITAPKLFISSEEDAAAIVSQEELLEAANDPKDSQTYSGNLHGTALFASDSEHASAVSERVIAFLDRYGGP